MAPATSMSAASDDRHHAIVQQWVQQALEIGSSFVSSLPPASQEQHLAVLFSSRQAGTLRRRFGGWMSWRAFALAASISMSTPSEQAAMDFVAGLVEGVRGDRGSTRTRSSGASSTVSAMRFVASLLRLTEMAQALSSPVILAWLQHNARSSRAQLLGRREALPLPLSVVMALETAFSTAVGDDVFFLGAILLMIWASLRSTQSLRRAV